ncbi:protein SENESCENCE-ASSOCIATED GENE 21, mitochondrial-like isoform X2 [Papaver somniferum]|uniref:protein SENESCENCE-ASSOCIATED GENE 21, mitochondrial-like isoform X2 n=1 Tax=Papaver somniferum TaxID=3469 RepID=UPI000E6F7208|nr:protein SENESCENCE-ASSOCIATED GENE 21, mitochondrial-like isoform X2 [Papaver somniferum]
MAASRLAYALKKCLLPLITRGYSASATENVKTSISSTVVKKVMSETGKAGNKTVAAIEKESNGAFWMKDPKTGNWIPENHFNEVDVAELRNKLLSKK